MLLLVVVFAGLAIWALGQRSEAQKQAEVARSQALAASAVSQLDADPELGLLLAVEAADGKPTREAEDALRRALTSSRLRAVVPTRGPVRSAAISPDDSRVLTVDGLGIAHVRSATGGGGDLASFGAGLVNDAAFDPTGRLIVTANKDGTARIVDASRGEERLVIRAGSAPVVAARFSARRAPRAHRFEGRRCPHLRRTNGQAWGGRTCSLAAAAGTSSARAARQSCLSGEEATRACGAGRRASRRGTPTSLRS